MLKARIWIHLRFVGDCFQFVLGDHVDEEDAVLLIDVGLEHTSLKANLQEAMKRSIVDSIEVGATFVLPVLVVLLILC